MTRKSLAILVIVISILLFLGTLITCCVLQPVCLQKQDSSLMPRTHLDTSKWLLCSATPVVVFACLFLTLI